MLKILLIVTTLLALPQITLAGIFELGISGSYKRSNINADNYTIENSTTGTISYYYGEMSAIELSYTNGVRRNSYSIGGDTAITTNYSTMMGVDLVFSFADRSATFQPFVKAGLAQLEKTNYYKTTTQPEAKTPGFSGTVPSVGIGFRVRITKATAIKAGADAWSVKQDGDSATKSFSDWDHAARVGVTWMF